MNTESASALHGVICLLVINKIEQMPEIAVQSILANCSENIIIGYRNYSDVSVFDNRERISLLNLSAEYDALRIADGSDVYAGWENEDFFRIVQLKWDMIQKILTTDLDFIIYTDLDVIWLSNAFDEVRQTFEKRPRVELQIQSFTRSSFEPHLCMGFVAFRKTKNIQEFLIRAKERHRSELKTNPRIGDDDVITILNREMVYPSWLIELSQIAFPVGSSFSLFSNRGNFPGLFAQRPKIFHANYVIGLNNKLIMMKAFLGKELRIKYGARFRPKEYLYFRGKSLKWFVLNRIKNHL